MPLAISLTGLLVGCKTAAPAHALHKSLARSNEPFFILKIQISLVPLFARSFGQVPFVFQWNELFRLQVAGSGELLTVTYCTDHNTITISKKIWRQVRPQAHQVGGSNFLGFRNSPILAENSTMQGLGGRKCHMDTDVPIFDSNSVLGILDKLCVVEALLRGS